MKTRYYQVADPGGELWFDEVDTLAKAVKLARERHGEVWFVMRVWHKEKKR